MTTPGEEQPAEQQTEDSPPTTGEPSQSEQQPDGDAPKPSDEPSATEDQTDSAPAPTEEESRKKSDDFFDVEPGKGDKSGDGDVTMNVEPSNEADVSEERGDTGEPDGGVDQVDAVPVLDPEPDVPVIESSTPAAEEAPPASEENTAPAANDCTAEPTETAADNTATAASDINDNTAASDNAASNETTETPQEAATENSPETQGDSTEAQEEQKTPAEEQSTSAETDTVTPQVEVTVTEAELVSADGGEAEISQKEEAGIDTDTAAEGKDGGDAIKEEDVTDSPAPIAAPAPANVGSECLIPQPAETRPSTVADDYEDDFHSELSEKSECDTSSAVPVVPNQDAADETSIQGTKSPALSTNDETRAEANAVVPVPSAVIAYDGRSQAEERGEYRGEDRSEVQSDGGENSRGQGQWKSEEEILVEASTTEQNNDKEALQKVTEEIDRLEKELDVLKGRYMVLEESSKQSDMEATMLKEKCQQLEARIKELEAEVAQLQEEALAAKENESKVKDLQERLATLSEEDSKKGLRIQKLEEDLQETQCRLTAAEHQATVLTEASEQASNQPPPQSKTCVVM